MTGKVRIKVEGQLDFKWKEWFENMDIAHEDHFTILSGTIEDEAALHGILNKIRDLNLPLVSVNFE